MSTSQQLAGQEKIIWKSLKRFGDKNLDGQSQKRAKLSLQDIEENSIDQLIIQPSQSSSRVSLL
jgi:hypothetical protein